MLDERRAHTEGFNAITAFRKIYDIIYKKPFEWLNYFGITEDDAPDLLLLSNIQLSMKIFMPCYMSGTTLQKATGMFDESGLVSTCETV